MRPITLRFKKISGEILEKNEASKNITFSSNFDMTNLKKQEKQVIPGEIVFEVDFSQVYNFEKLAKLEFKGKVFFSINESEKDTLEELNKSKEMKNPNVNKMILDYIFKKTHVHSIELEEKLGLPFHVPTPSVNLK